MAGIVLLSLVVALALNGPPARNAAHRYRTEPVMSALGLQPEELAAQAASAAAVPSLSVTPRLVLPTVRAESKRVLPIETPAFSPARRRL